MAQMQSLRCGNKKLFGYGAIISSPALCRRSPCSDAASLHVNPPQAQAVGRLFCMFLVLEMVPGAEDDSWY